MCIHVNVISPDSVSCWWLQPKMGWHKIIVDGMWSELYNTKELVLSLDTRQIYHPLPTTTILIQPLFNEARTLYADRLNSQKHDVLSMEIISTFLGIIWSITSGILSIHASICSWGSFSRSSRHCWAHSSLVVEVGESLLIWRRIQDYTCCEALRSGELDGHNNLLISCKLIYSVSNFDIWVGRTIFKHFNASFYTFNLLREWYELWF